MRKLLGLILAMLIVATGTVAAETVPGRIKKIDTDKNTITVTVDDKDTTYPVEAGSKIFQPGKGKKNPQVDVPGGLKGLKEGQPVVLTTDKKDGKEVVTQIKLEEQAKKPKK